MRKLLVITQKVDENDDHRGFFIDWLKEFAKIFDEIVVVTVAEGSYTLPENIHVYSLGKERGFPKIIQAVRFYWYLFRFIPGSNGIFAHASAIFVIVSWPVTFVFRKKIVLWYLHRSVTFRLKIAEKLCYKIVTATKESLGFFSGKIIETGHGINIDKFRLERSWLSNGKLNVLSVGRISKIKNYEILLETANILKNKNIDFGIKIIGQPVMPNDFKYLNFLKELKEKLNLNSYVKFMGSVPHNKIVQYFQESNVVIGLTPDGGVDKVILEGMASGCLVLTSNNVCRNYFGNYGDKLIFSYRNSEDLSEKIINLSKLTSEIKKEISDFMVQSVSNHHELSRTIKHISSLFT
jgi:glycosyltransferase involved in cell wall biosynthesis